MTMVINDNNGANLDAILEEAGFPGARARSFGGGMYNEAYLIEDGERRFVLRIAPPDHVPQLFYEKCMMRLEPAIHRMIREQTGIHVPDVVYHNFSRKIIDRDYIILEFVEGEPGPFDHAELGRYTREMHEIQGTEFGYPDRDAKTGNSWPAKTGRRESPHPAKTVYGL